LPIGFAALLFFGMGGAATDCRDWSIEGAMPSAVADLSGCAMLRIR
jgi:hypothetical protein